jgi:hypothetical protein
MHAISYETSALSGSKQIFHWFYSLVHLRNIKIYSLAGTVLLTMDEKMDKA